jgi:hypothetical protein
LVVDATQLLSTIHRYNRRPSINVDTEEENYNTITTEKPQTLDNTNCRIGRCQLRQGMGEVERITASDPIVVEKAKVFSNSVGLIL